MRHETDDSDGLESGEGDSRADAAGASPGRQEADADAWRRSGVLAGDHGRSAAIVEARGAVADVYAEHGDPAETMFTTREAEAIHAYTDAEYTQLNGALRKGSLEDIAQIAAESHDLTAALSKCEPYAGRAYRGAQVDADVLSRYEPGATVVEGAYTSASRAPERAFDGNVLWEIDGANARDVSGLSAYGAEQEVLFDRFAKFEVTEKQFDEATSRWLIRMRQL